MREKQIVKYSEANIERCKGEIEELMLDALAVVEGRPCRCSEQDSCCDCAFRPDTIQCQCNSEYGMMIKEHGSILIWQRLRCGTRFRSTLEFWSQ